MQGCLAYGEKDGRTFNPHGWIAGAECGTCADLPARRAAAFDDFTDLCAGFGITDTDEVHERWMKLQKAKPVSQRMFVWTPSARSPERHAAVLAEFRRRTQRDASKDHPAPAPRPMTPEQEAQYRQVLGHLDRIVKLRENREAKARGEAPPHKVKRAHKQQAQRP
jgi:hypothetical protein